MGQDKVEVYENFDREIIDLGRRISLPVLEERLPTPAEVKVAILNIKMRGVENAWPNHMMCFEKFLNDGPSKT